MVAEDPSFQVETDEEISGETILKGMGESSPRHQGRYP
ncbi:hypothetical protein OH492_04890 [Vibrio chagasii]|nr:hypothetical protein [Vibrio chagasii]